MAKRIAAIYGESLFKAAAESGRTDDIYREALCVAEALDSDDELTEFLCHPDISRDDKITVLENVFKDNFSGEFMGFLVTVVNKDRSSGLKDMLHYFIGRYKEYRKIGTAYVTTPSELTSGLRDRIHKKLLDTTDYAEIEMVYDVKPELIGGMVIRIGDRVVDSSIRTRLDKMVRELNRTACEQ